MRNYSEKEARELLFCNILAWHEAGITGQGMVIFNAELDELGEHGEATTDIIQLVAPGATIINGRHMSRFNPNNPDAETNYLKFKMTDGEALTPMEIYEKYKPDVITVSFSGQEDYFEQQMQPLIKKGVIVFCAAGNYDRDDPDGGVTGRYKNIALVVGAARLRSTGDVSVYPYSRYEDLYDVHLCGFTGNGSGTSCATPWIASQCLLWMQEFGRLNQTEFYKAIEPCMFDIYSDGDDILSGKGLLIMPEITKTSFIDVEKDRWSAQAIEWVNAQGLMTGVGDDKFDPTGIVTREQLAVVLYRLKGGG